MNSDESNGQGLDAQSDHKVSVMLVDDDPIFLQTIATSLQTYSLNTLLHHQLDIVGFARSSEDLILNAQALTPKVVLLDLEIPEQGGLWAIPLLHILFPETRVIALTHQDNIDSRSAVLAAGGTDLVSKTLWHTDLIPAIQRAMETQDIELDAFPPYPSQSAE